jgi:hypothetical protein
MSRSPKSGPAIFPSSLTVSEVREARSSSLMLANETKGEGGEERKEQRVSSSSTRTRTIRLSSRLLPEELVEKNDR